MGIVLFLIFITLICFIIDQNNKSKELLKKYPNFFDGSCGYCSKKHGKNQWWFKNLGHQHCIRHGLIFLDKKCFEQWKKENIVCVICNNTQSKNSNKTIIHKFQKQTFSFCSEVCKNEFQNNHPEVFYKGHRRHSIPTDLRKIIWNRDEGKCVKCGSENNIHYDHIIPISKGGSTIKENLELLCQNCNLSKSDKIE